MLVAIWGLKIQALLSESEIAEFVCVYDFAMWKESDFPLVVGKDFAAVFLATKNQQMLAELNSLSVSILFVELGMPHIGLLLNIDFEDSFTVVEMSGSAYN